MSLARYRIVPYFPSERAPGRCWIERYEGFSDGAEVWAPIRDGRGIWDKRENAEAEIDRRLAGRPVAAPRRRLRRAA